MRRWLLLSLVVACDCGETAKPKAPIARCADKEGDVRSHPAETTTWDPLAAGAMLEAGAWIQTAEAAWARIEFLSGSELQIDPGSVVVLDLPEEESRGQLVSLRSGTVRGAVNKGAKGRRLVVKTAAGKRLRIDADEGDVSYRLRVAKAGEVELAVTSGKAKVVSEDGRQVELVKGQVQSTANGELVGEVAKLPEPPGPPEAEQRGAQLVLSWPAAEGAKQYRVVVRREGRIIRDALVAETSLTLDESPGEIEWTVQTVDAAGRESVPTAASRTTIREEIPDRLVSPADGATVRHAQAKPMVQFEWRAEGPSSLTVARDRALSDVVLQEEVTTPRVRTRALSQGSYYWMVREKGKPLAPAPRKLTLKRSRRGLRLPKKLKWK